MPVMRFIVRWHSAMPVKQALIRSAIGAEGDLTDEHRTFLDREEKYYIVMLSGIPQRASRRASPTTSSVSRALRRSSARARLL